MKLLFLIILSPLFAFSQQTIVTYASAEIVSDIVLFEADSLNNKNVYIYNEKITHRELFLIKDNDKSEMKLNDILIIE